MVVLTGEGEATLITTENPKVTRIISNDSGGKTIEDEARTASGVSQRGKGRDYEHIRMRR
jgi:hypothetical protein